MYLVLQHACDGGAEAVHVAGGHARDIDAAAVDDIDAVFLTQGLDLFRIEPAEGEHAALAGQE